MGAVQTHQDEVPLTVYRLLAEFRYHIRKFLHFSEEASRAVGIEPQQYLLLIAIKGLPEGIRPTITAISSRLSLRHHSTVELIDRLVERGALVRRHSEQDRREVLIELTPHGEHLVRSIAILNWEELQNSGAAFSEALQHIVNHATEGLRSSR